MIPSLWFARMLLLLLFLYTAKNDESPRYEIKELHFRVISEAAADDVS